MLFKPRTGALTALLCALALILWASVAHCATLRLRWTWPCFVDSIGCAIMDSTAEARVLESLGPPADSVFIPDSSWFLTNLDHGTIWGVRCSSINDTLRIGDIDATGKECTADSVDLDILDGSVGWVWMTAVDHDGDESCVTSWVTFAFPATGAPPPDTTAPAPPPPSHAGLLGTYFRDTSLGVSATMIDTTIAFSWGDGPLWPGGASDNASVRWTGLIDVPTSGTWTLSVASDDGVRLYIDGALVMDEWHPRWDETSWTGVLSGGQHALTLEYLELGGGALCQLRWEGPGISRSLVPASAFSH